MCKSVAVHWIRGWCSCGTHTGPRTKSLFLNVLYTMYTFTLDYTSLLILFLQTTGGKTWWCIVQESPGSAANDNSCCCDIETGGNLLAFALWLLFTLWLFVRINEGCRRLNVNEDSTSMHSVTASLFGASGASFDITADASIGFESCTRVQTRNAFAGLPDTFSEKDSDLGIKIEFPTASTSNHSITWSGPQWVINSIPQSRTSWGKSSLWSFKTAITTNSKTTRHWRRRLFKVIQGLGDYGKDIVQQTLYFNNHLPMWWPTSTY